MLAVLACHQQQSPPPVSSDEPAPRAVIVAEVDRIERDGRSLSVYRELAKTDPRLAPARRALESRPVRRLLLLLDLTRGLRKQQPPPGGVDEAAWTRALDAPFYLSVAGSVEEHGGAGFILRTDRGDVSHIATPFVELVGDATQIADPFYARSLVHETSHALLALAAAQWFLPCEQARWSCGRVPSAFHDVQRPTQPAQALNEGYAEYMEAMAFLEKPGAEVLGWAIASEGAVAAARAFVSPRGRRIDNVIWNRAIFEPARIPESLIARDGIDAAHRTYQDSQPTDNHRLKTCREMLSTEGAVASLLLRLASDHALRSAPLPPAVHAMLPTGAARTAWLDALGPTAAIELRLIYLFARMPSTTPAENGERGVRDVIELWRSVFPTDTKSVTRVVVTSSLGATASASLAAKLRGLLAAPEIVPALDPNRPQLRAATRELLALADSPALAGGGLFAACGPPLWIDVPGRRLCSDFGGLCLPLELDLNAASELDLRLLPGVDAEHSKHALTVREQRGYFENREQALAAAGVTAQTMSQLRPRPIPRAPE